jgi:hypothetical protein
MFILVPWRACLDDYVIHKQDGRIKKVQLIDSFGSILFDGNSPGGYDQWDFDEYYVLHKIYDSETPLKSIPEIKKALAEALVFEQ